MVLHLPSSFCGHEYYPLVADRQSSLNRRQRREWPNYPAECLGVLGKGFGGKVVGIDAL